MEIIQVPALSDNYNYILRDQTTGKTAAIDPSEARPTIEVLEERGWDLDYILHTHHHYDHIGGDAELCQKYGSTIVGPKYDAHRIPNMKVELEDNQVFRLGESIAEVFYVPGHTLGHIAYYFSEAEALFCGDVIFSLGSGFLFEGTPEQMWNSLRRLRNLPDSTKVYCAHEYTLENAEFALQFETKNSDLVSFVEAAKKLRAQNKPTVPSLLGEEKKCNPFLRADMQKVKEILGMENSPDHEVLGKIRHSKDVFDGNA